MGKKENLLIFLKNKFIRIVNSPYLENPRFIIFLIIVSYLLVVFIRFILFSLFTETCANGDEYLYKGMALSFFKYGNFFELNFARNSEMTYFLYPLIISPAFYFGENFYIFIKLINSFLINLSIFPVFLLAKEFMSYKKAYFTSLMVLLIPFLNIGYVVMRESLFLPLFLITFYICYKLFVNLKLKYAFLSGFSMSLLILTKITGIFLIITFILTVAVIQFLPKERAHRRKILYLSIISISCLIVSVYILKLIFLNNTGLVLRSLPGSGVKRIFNFSKFDFSFLLKAIYMILSHISTFLMLSLLPFFISVFSLIKAIKMKKIGEYMALLMGLIFSLVMFVFILWRTFHYPTWVIEFKLVGRYYFMIYPIYIIVFAGFYNKIDWNKRQKIIITISFLLTLIINVFIFIPKIVLSRKVFGAMANMDVIWIYSSFLRWGRFGKALFIMVQIVSLFMLLYYLFRNSKRIYPFFVFFLIIVIISNYAILMKMSGINERMLKFRKNYLSFVRAKIPEHSQNVALISSKKPFMRGYFSFWLHYDYTNNTRFRLPESEIVTKDMLPEGTQWVLVEGDYKIGFPFKAIYKKGKYTIVQIPPKIHDVKKPK